MKSIKIIAIGQGGGPTPVINDEVAGALYEAKEAGLKVYGVRNGLYGLLHADVPGNVIDITDWDPGYVRQPPGAILGTTRMKLKAGEDDDKIEVVRANIERVGIDGIIYFGGNDTAEVLQALGMGVHGSKTIDNDLGDEELKLVHHTPGYGSAALLNATGVIKAYRDIVSYRTRRKNSTGRPIYSVAPVAIVQVMGRDTGWLTLSTAFSKVNENGKIDPERPPYIIWPPEIAFDKDRFLSELSDTLQKKGEAFVVIGEELVDKKEGKTLAELYTEELRDEHGHTEHARAGSFNYAEHLAMLAKPLRVEGVDTIKETPLRIHHYQRCFMKSAVDADEAYEVGRESIRAILEGDEQVSVVLQQDEGYHGYKMRPARVPLEEIAGKTRRVPERFIDGIRGPTQEFVDEFLSTIGGAEALPHYAELDFNRIVTPLMG